MRCGARTNGAEKGRLGEEETRVLFGQLCLAVAYVHEKGIVHRDLKLENVLLDERCRVKLGDFGFTREFEKGSLLETFCGTTGYAAPEMLLAQKYLGPGALSFLEKYPAWHDVGKMRTASHPARTFQSIQRRSHVPTCGMNTFLPDRDIGNSAFRYPPVSFDTTFSVV